MLPRDVFFWACVFARPSLPLHTLLRLPQGTGWAEWAAAGYFRAFRAILGSGCETPWAGGSGQALVSACRTTFGLGMAMAGAGQGGGKQWDVCRSQPKESPGSCRGQAGGEGAGGRAAWRGAGGGVLERLLHPPGTLLQKQGLRDQLQQSSDAGHSPAGSSSHPANKGPWCCGEGCCRVTQGFGVTLQTLPLPQCKY